MDVCHCGMCRRQSAGPFFAVEVTDVQLKDENHLGVYASSDWGERCFCKTCGTILFWRMRDGSHIAASAMAFDHPEGFQLTSEIFIDKKPANYALAGERSRLTAAEVMALFTGETK